MQVTDVQISYNDQGKLNEIAIEIREGGRVFWRVVTLSVLKRLPRSNRESPSLIERTRKALKAAYGAQVDLAVLYANIPERGIAQLYGAVAEDNDREKATAQAHNGLSLILGMFMAAFPQSRFEPPEYKIVEFIRKSFEDNPYALAFVGQPDPRESMRAPLPDGVGKGAKDAASRNKEVGLQQNEYIFRGMRALNKPFLSLFLFNRVGNGDPKDLFRLMERVRAEASVWRSRVQGVKGWNVGVSIPVFLTGLNALGAGGAYGASHANSVQHSQGHTFSQADAVGHANTQSWSRAVSNGTGWAHSVVQSHAVSNGVANSTSQMHSAGTSHVASSGVADSSSHMTGVGVSHGVTNSHMQSQNWGHASSSGSNWGTTMAHTDSSGWNAGGTVSFGPKGIIGGADLSGGFSGGHSNSVANMAGGFAGVSNSVGGGSASGQAVSNGTVHTSASGTAHSISHGTANGISQANSFGSAHSKMHSVMNGQAVGNSTSGMHSVTNAVGGGSTDSRTHVTGQANSYASGAGRSVGVVEAQTLQATRAVGMGMGIAPSIGFNRSYQAIDYVSDMVADALEDQIKILDHAAMEGAYFVDAYTLLPDAEARQAMKGLFVEAFHGEQGVATPVQPVDLTEEEERRVREYALAFAPVPDPEHSPFAMEGYKLTTLTTLTQAAAYAAPGAFEEGEADTVSEEIPPFAFPQQDKGLLLGHLHSVERDRLTTTPVRLPRERMGNFMATADTRFGKSVVCERLALEAVKQWQFRAVVLDFGLGWRRLRPMLPDRFDIWGLSPQSPRPIRWNPLQIGRRILPESQHMVTCEMIANAGRMGERQLGFLQRTLRALYLDHGVLVNDEEVLRSDNRWSKVQDLEAPFVNLPAGAPLASLSMEELQRLAVQRSKNVDITMWYKKIRALQKTFAPRDPSYSSIEGILLRLAPFTQGRLARMFGRGEGSVAVEDLALPWGMTVLEGGLLQGMEYIKSVLLGLMAWHLYTDAVVRSSQGGENTPMIILFEEGNKVITAGGALSSDDKSSGSAQTTEIFQSMFRDAGKYNIYLGVIAQSPAELPAGIISSCNVQFVGQLKNPNDIKTAASAIGRTPQGFVDTAYLRFIASLPKELFIGKWALGMDRSQTESFLFHPLYVAAPMPSDDEIRQLYAFGGGQAMLN